MARLFFARGISLERIVTESSALSLYNELLGVICLRHKVNSIQHNTANTREDSLLWVSNKLE